MKYNIQFFYYVSNNQDVTYIISCKNLGALSVAYYTLNKRTCALEKVHNIVDSIIAEDNLNKLTPDNQEFQDFKNAFNICKAHKNYNVEDSEVVVDHISKSI